MFPIRRNVLINSQKGAYSTGHPNVKGEACGHLRFHCHDFNTKTGSAIPADISEMQISELPKWILVIEKYSVYERLVSQGYHKDKPCLLITGRGKKIIFKPKMFGIIFKQKKITGYSGNSANVGVFILFRKATFLGNSFIFRFSV